MLPINQKVIAAIVTFNGSCTIQETLNALTAQTRKPEAFLIIDNASTDKTLEVVQLLPVNNLKIMKLKKNEGVAVAYNLAFKESFDHGFDWL